MHARPQSVVGIAQLREYDEVIDVRSPAEFAEDHVPGAVNCPVLDDAERAQVGTIYKQVSPFEARKVGAALVARNIARHLEQRLHDRPRDWRPLVYCWRGGQRSGAMLRVLEEVGWRGARLEGGYRSYRRAVMEDLQRLPATLQFRVVCGATGSGKSRLLAALAAAGAQVLDLEDRAAHRGSVLGNLPDAAQPGQKMFESLVWDDLNRMDPARPVFVEAESKKIGRLHVPDALLARMWASPCLRLEAPPAVRVRLLMEDYAHLAQDPEEMCRKLALLRPLHGGERIAAWQSLAREGRGAELVGELLARHYDPAYARSSGSHYPELERSPVLALGDGSADDFARVAREAVAASATAA